MSFYSRYNGFNRGLPDDIRVPTGTAQPLAVPTGTLVARASDIARPTRTAMPVGTPDVRVDDGAYAQWLAAQQAPGIFSVPLAGPVKLWHVLAAAGLAGAGYVAYKKFR